MSGQNYKVAGYVKLCWSLAAATTTGKSGGANPENGNWRTPSYARLSARSLLVAVRPTVVLDSLMRLVVRDGVTALLGSCAKSASLLGNAPSIASPRPTAATADQSRLIVCAIFPCNKLTKSGRPMPPVCSPAVKLMQP